MLLRLWGHLTFIYMYTALRCAATKEQKKKRPRVHVVQQKPLAFVWSYIAGMLVVAIVTSISHFADSLRQADARAEAHYWMTTAAFAGWGLRNLCHRSILHCGRYFWCCFLCWLSRQSHLRTSVAVHQRWRSICPPTQQHSWQLASPHSPLSPPSHAPSHQVVASSWNGLQRRAQLAPHQWRCWGTGGLPWPGVEWKGTTKHRTTYNHCAPRAQMYIHMDLKLITVPVLMSDDVWVLPVSLQ